MTIEAHKPQFTRLASRGRNCQSAASLRTSLYFFVFSRFLPGRSLTPAKILPLTNRQKLVERERAIVTGILVRERRVEGVRFVAVNLVGLSENRKASIRVICYPARTPER